jgi:hypothetical protein
MFFLSALALLLACLAILRSFFFFAAASLSVTEKMGPAWNYPIVLTVSSKPLQAKRANRYLIARRSRNFSRMSLRLELSDQVWSYWLPTGHTAHLSSK